MLVYYGINNITPLICNFENQELKFVTTNGGETFNQYISISLKEFSTYDFSKVTQLIICSMFVEEILNGLLSINFPVEKVFFYNCTTCTIDPIKVVTPNVQESDFLLAVYDLKTNLASFDIINFLVLAELKRIELNKKYIKFIIVPSRSNQHLFISDLHHTESDLNWRISHIINPLIKALPSVKSITELTYREEFVRFSDIFDIFPQNYSIKTPPHQFSYSNSILKSAGVNKVFTPALVAKELVASFLNGLSSKSKKVVTITLREYEKQSERNSDLISTVKFCSYLEKEGFYPIVIRDTYTFSNSENDELISYCKFPAASIDLDLRLALYQASFLNISVNTGPCYLFYFTKNVNSIEFRWIDESVFSISEKTMQQAGYIKDQQPSFASIDNIVFWGKDSYENLKTGFLSFRNRHEQKKH